MSEENVDKYLPLTEATYYIMTALDEPLHGYAVMQRVEQTSAGTVKLGPGTLYGAFSTLEKEKLIQKVAEDERRKSYMLTEKGRLLLRRQVERLEIMLRNGQRFLLANNAK
jgi:DNA-binding PadR family transcriptional regulator